MRAADIDLAAMLKFQPEQGRLLLNGQRMLLFSQAALGTLDALLVEHLGHEFADALFAQFGYRCAAEDYDSLDAIAAWDSDTERMMAGPAIHRWEGIVGVTVTELDFDRQAGHFLMRGIWSNSYQAANHLARFGRSPRPVCSALTGYASGWSSKFFGRPLLAIETQCAAMGDPQCGFEIRPEAAWDDRAEPWAAMLGATSDSVSRALESLVARRTAQLEQARYAAEQANRTKSQFLANISHELRTPMNGVIGVAQLLRDVVTEPRARELVDLIIESGNQQVAIISDLLDYSKIEAGQMSVERRAFDLNRMLSNLVATFSAQAANRGIRLVTELAADLPRTAISDSVKVNQILFNLVGNAIKFTPQGGAVTLAVSHAPLAPESSAAAGGSGLVGSGGPVLVCFRIADTGIGMTPEQLDRLFTPFMQADTTVTRRFGGTGLGLVISKELVELLGGTLQVSSEHGRGSTFTVSLTMQLAAPPATQGAGGSAPVAAAPPVAPAGRPASRQPLRVLVAEDNRINALVVRRMLEGMDALVQVVGDGRAALSAWEAEDFDLVLLDLHMPELDGIGAVAEIRRREAQRECVRVPAVALTADAFEETRLACLAAGFDSFLTKPLDRAQLVELIQGLLPGTAAEGVSP